MLRTWDGDSTTWLAARLAGVGCTGWRSVRMRWVRARPGWVVLMEVSSPPGVLVGDRDLVRTANARKERRPRMQQRGAGPASGPRENVQKEEQFSRGRRRTDAGRLAGSHTPDGRFRGEPRLANPRLPETEILAKTCQESRTRTTCKPIWGNRLVQLLAREARANQREIATCTRTDARVWALNGVSLGKTPQGRRYIRFPA